MGGDKNTRRTSNESVSCGRSPGRRGRAGHGLGKLLGRSPSTAGHQHQPVQLGLVADEVSRKRCLVDTGSQVSLWPPTTSTSNLQRSSVRLTAGNGTPIKAFGKQSRKIKIGGKTYKFVFLVAQVSRPILGLDFLQAFGMTLDLRHRRLIHDGTSTRFSTTSTPISGVNVVHSSPFAHLLVDFPEITDAALASSSSKHGLECYIKTTGPPVRTAPR